MRDGEYDWAVDSRAEQMLLLLLLLGTRPASVRELSTVTGIGPDELRETLALLDERWLITQAGETAHLLFPGQVIVRKLCDLLESHYRAVTVEGGRAQIRALLAEFPGLRIISDPVVCKAQRTLFLETGGSRSPDPDVEDLYRTMITMIRFGHFFETHAYDTLPVFVLERIGDLYTAELVYDFAVDFSHSHRHFIDILRRARHIHGISGYATPNIAAAMAKVVLLGREVELIITPDLALELSKEPYMRFLAQLRRCHNLRFRISPIPIAVGITVTDRCLSFGLATRGGQHYDATYDLVSSDPAAIAWGEQFFQYYHERSVSPEDFFGGRVHLP